MSEEQERKSLFKKPQTIALICLIILSIVLLAIFKYKALFAIVIIAIVGISIFVNRSILRKRKLKDTQEVKQYNLADSDKNKFSQYFVSRDETYISSLGNGYLANFLSSGNLSKGFAVITNKRVYFRGSCFSGQGKSLVKSNEERTVDIKDITGSGFIYKRYLGILLGLAVSLATLIAGIGWSFYVAAHGYTELSYYQSESNNFQTKISDIKKADRLIEDNQKKIDKNNETINELKEKINTSEAPLPSQTKTVVDVDNAVYNFGLTDTYYSTAFCKAYKTYLSEVSQIAANSEIVSMINTISAEAASVPSSDFTSKILAFYAEGSSQIESKDARGTLPEYANNSPDTYYLGPASTVYNCGYDNRLIALACDIFDTCKNNPAYMVSTLIQNPDLIQRNYFSSFDDEWSWDLSVRLYNERENAVETKAYREAYDKFLSDVAPIYADGTSNPSYMDIMAEYVNIHPEEFGDFTVEVALETEPETEKTDPETEEAYSKIDELEKENKELSKEIDNLSKDLDKISHYEESQKKAEKEATKWFASGSVFTAVAGLLATFLVSCLLVFLDYLKKRKTMFQIQYAGGYIAFDVSYYAKAEIDDFQKQLRRTKDFAEEVKATVNVAPAPSPVQVETPQTSQNSAPDDLRKYAELLKDGLISQEDYDAMKKKILGL